MAKTRGDLKNLFKAGCYPSQADFGELIDSFLAAGDEIGIAKVQGLEAALGNKLDQSRGNAMENNITANASAISAEASRAKTAEADLRAKAFKGLLYYAEGKSYIYSDEALTKEYSYSKANYKNELGLYMMNIGYGIHSWDFFTIYGYSGTIYYFLIEDAGPKGGGRFVLSKKCSVFDVVEKADSDLGNTDYWYTLNDINRRISSAEWNGGYPGVMSPGQYILYDEDNYKGILLVSGAGRTKTQDMITPDGVKYRHWDNSIGSMGGDWSPTWITRIDFNNIVSGGGEGGILDAPKDGSSYARKNSEWHKLGNVAVTGSYNDLKDTPSLRPVATTGDYNDLINLPISVISQSELDNFGGYMPSGVYAVVDSSYAAIMLYESFSMGNGKQQTLYNNGVVKQRRASGSSAWGEWEQIGGMPAAPEKKILYVNTVPTDGFDLSDVDEIIWKIPFENWVIKNLPVSDDPFTKELCIISNGDDIYCAKNDKVIINGIEYAIVQNVNTFSPVEIAQSSTLNLNKTNINVWYRTLGGATMVRVTIKYSNGTYTLIYNPIA